VKQQVFALLLPVVFYVTVFNLFLKRLWAWAKTHPWPAGPGVGWAPKAKPQ
jgi:hypothetical protein